MATRRTTRGRKAHVVMELEPDTANVETVSKLPNASVVPAQVDPPQQSGQNESAALNGNGEQNEVIKAKAKRKVKEKEVNPPGATDSKIPKYEPEDWKAMLENIQKMRANKDAPVDSMGCERSMEEHVEPKVRRFQTLLSLMLSSQTKDPVTFAAMERLKSGVPLTVQKMLDMSEEELGKTIIPVGFWRRKAQYIKKTCEILRKDFDDDIPTTVEGLCALPGVGPKMAYICMNVAWEKNAGIGVDTHVHRISNRLKWSGLKEAKTPEDTRKALESWLPEDMWQEINILLVGFGQTVCLPVRPKCDTCLNISICKFGQRELRTRTPQKTKPKPSVTVSPLGPSMYFDQNGAT